MPLDDDCEMHTGWCLNVLLKDSAIPGAELGHAANDVHFGQRCAAVLTAANSCRMHRVEPEEPDLGRPCRSFCAVHVDRDTAAGRGYRNSDYATFVDLCFS